MWERRQKKGKNTSKITASKIILEFQTNLTAIDIDMIVLIYYTVYT